MGLLQDTEEESGMLSKSSQAYQQIEHAAHYLVHGVVISIDPSVGSRSSMPGWAAWREGELQDSGILRLDVGAALHRRLRQLAREMRKVYDAYQPDVLVYEEIPAQRHGGNAANHASLLKAVGVILSVPGPEVVGIYPVSWKKLVRPEYVKSDEADAIELGWVSIEEAKKILSRQKSKEREE